jgi:hypothetical protein
MLFLPDSPRYLFHHGREEEAREVLQKIRGVEDVEEELKTIELECESNEEEAQWRDLLKSEYRSGTLPQHFLSERTIRMLRSHVLSDDCRYWRHVLSTIHGTANGAVLQHHHF